MREPMPDDDCREDVASLALTVVHEEAVNANAWRSVPCNRDARKPAAVDPVSSSTTSLSQSRVNSSMATCTRCLSLLRARGTACSPTSMTLPAEVSRRRIGDVQRTSGLTGEPVSPLPRYHRRLRVGPLSDCRPTMDAR